jgi:hypothetical protein
MYLATKKTVLILAVLGFTLTACKKNEATAPEAAPPPPRSASIETEAAPAPPPPSTPAPEAAAEATPPPTDVTDKMPTAPNDSSLATGAVHQQLTLALHRYFENNSKMPQTFQDLVTAKYIDKMPTPPPGKTFAIDRRHLQVVVVPK